MNKERTLPVPGEFYRHFKNRFYQIVTIAYHSETSEPMVVYQALYGEFKVWVRPLSMFMEEVDHVKYPEADQTYRFEKVERSELAAVCQTPVEEVTQKVSETISEKVLEEVLEETSEEMNPETEKIDARVMEFLDTDDFDTRYNILVSMRDDITDMQINTLAVALDVVIPEGDITDRYEQLKHCLRTRQKYESSRLR